MVELTTLTPAQMAEIEMEARRMRAKALASYARSFGAWVKSFFGAAASAGKAGRVA